MKTILFALLSLIYFQAYSKTLTIDITNTAPIIDGFLEDEVWGKTLWQKIDQRKGEVDDFYAEFKMIYNYDFVFIACKVIDLTPMVIGQSGWQSDGIELYFAMDTSNSETYRSGDCFIAKIAAKSIHDDGVYVIPLERSEIIKNIQVEQIRIDNSYIQEWAIPWKSLGLIGFEFRFDIMAIQANDEVNGRVGQLFWNSAEDDQYRRVKNQGLVNLLKIYDYFVNVDEITSKINIYPNPASNFLHIESLRSIKEYEVYDLYNRLIIKRKVYAEEFNVNLNSFPAGEYIIKLYTEEGTVINKVITKK